MLKAPVVFIEHIFNWCFRLKKTHFVENKSIVSRFKWKKFGCYYHEHVEKNESYKQFFSVYKSFINQTGTYE